MLWPMASVPAIRVICSALGLNVKMWPFRSVVASPLVRLSITCWLNAWRSAIWLDARCNLASA